MVLSILILTLAFDGIAIMAYFIIMPENSYLNSIIVHPFNLLALILIRLYNEKRGLRLKYLFYIFYPAHLVILRFLNDNLINK
jgi:hypothetical protein